VEVSVLFLKERGGAALAKTAIYGLSERSAGIPPAVKVQISFDLWCEEIIRVACPTSADFRLLFKVYLSLIASLTEKIAVKTVERDWKLGCGHRGAFSRANGRNFSPDNRFYSQKLVFFASRSYP
jgi:hypothetical protein